MPVMSVIERAVCRSSPWCSFAVRRVLPWALDGQVLSGEILEVGGGSGAMAAGMAAMAPDVRLTVTDLDEAMVDTARTRLARYPNVAVQRANVTELPFAAARFDVVTSYLMLHHVVHWPEALAEIARVLKPGGALVGFDITDTRLARFVHTVDRSPHRILAADELAQGLTSAGFTDCGVRLSLMTHLMRFHARRA